MNINNLKISGCWLHDLDVFKDQRGEFFEWFQDSTNEKMNGKKFQIAQANCSVSTKGVLRGIHFTSRHPGQSKLVTVLSGKVFDVVVDLRKSSPTFGQWESVVLDANSPKALYIPWGVGHGFMSLEDKTVFAYLCDQRYNPTNEFDLNAFDADVNIEWPSHIQAIQSVKDKSAPFLDSLDSVLPD